MASKKPDLYKTPEDGVVLKYEMSTVPLQDQVGHVRRWAILVYQNGLASWHRMMETSVISKNKLTGSMPFIHSFVEPQALVVGLAGVTGLLLARRRGRIRQILYPLTAMAVTGTAMWITYPHNWRTFKDHCHNSWNKLTKS